MLDIKKFTTISEDVQAVLVTHENIKDVAEWVNLGMHEMHPGRFQVQMTDENDYAIVGDWVVHTYWAGYESLEAEADGSLNQKRYAPKTDN